MPKWVFHNPTKSLVHLPAPLHGAVRPGRNLEVITQAVHVDTPAMQALIKKGLLQVDAVIESSTINDKIEVPVVDFSEASLKFRYDWDVSVQYVMYDVVQDGGASWVALAPSLGTAPVEGPLWTFLGGGSASSQTKVGVELVPITSRLYQAPDIFIHNTGGVTIEVYHKTGRRLTEATGGDPRTGDYVVVEQGGVGSGYNQIRVVSCQVIGLVANYQLG